MKFEIYKNTKENSIREINFLNIPLYINKRQDRLQTQSFLNGLINTCKCISKDFEYKDINIFNKNFAQIRLENNEIKYFILGILLKKISITENFNKKYLKNIKFDFDNVYIINSNIGESLLFFAYLAKIHFKKNCSKKPLIFLTQKFQISLMHMFLPNLNYIYIGKNLKYILKYDQLQIDKHKIFIIFSSEHFHNVERAINNNNSHSTNYFQSALKILDLDIQDIEFPEININIENQNKLEKRIKKLNINLNNFIVLAPEANTCSELSVKFWYLCAEKLKQQGYDVFFNITSKKYKKIFKHYNSIALNLEEIFYLAQKAKFVISLRSGLTEFLLQTKTPSITIYTDFRNMPVDRIVTAYDNYRGFSLEHLPFFNNSYVKELIFDDYKNENNLITEIFRYVNEINMKESE